MSNLKDTDIDDLFRRASDKYPLRTDSADWDRMAAALEKEPPVPPNETVDTEEKRKKRRFLWLFLLLPLAGAGYFALHHGGNTGATGNIAKTGKAGTTTDATSTNASTTTSVSSAPSTPATTSATGTAASAHGTTTSATNTTASAHGTTTSATNTSVSTPGTTASALVTAAKNHDPAARQTSARASTQNLRSHSNIDNSTEEEAKPDNSFSLTAVHARQQPGGENGAIANGFTAASNDRLFYDLQRAPIPHDYHLAVDVTAPAAKKDSIPKPKAKTKHFYAGVFGSPDLSTVKMQSVKGVGSTFGLILGYTFNGGRWAIETGAYLDRKKYYTEGEYFSTKEIPLPPNAWLTDVNGICNMWEIPLNVRYNFNPGAKTSWFATAGLSTYLMTHEKYAGGLEWSGNPNVYDWNKSTYKSSQYPFSIINLSAGFEQRLGKIGNLRVEPYVRLPLGGLGAGKLPIMSAGVNIGITRQLW